MAIALDAIGNFVVIAATVGLEFGDKSKAPLTTLVIGPGHADDNDNLGGNAPHVALWDRNGHRIDQWTPHPNPKKNKDIIKEGQIFSIGLDNTQISGDEADPEYLLLSMNDDNALCVAAIQVEGNGDTWSWYGDVGKKCGAQWFHNDKPYGSDQFQPACVWISGPDHPHGYLYNGLAVHMPDFSTDTGIVQEFNDIPDAVCKSTARFHMYENIEPDGTVSFFQPPLEFKPDGSDVDPQRVIDKPPAPPRSKREDSKQRLQTRNNNNNDPTTLIITEHEAHGAKEVCESHTAVGPDLVSLNEKLFCEMGTGQLWPLCDASAKSNCFDVDAKMLKDGKSEKPYSNVKYWMKSA